MEYENDPLLPILQSEINSRTQAYQNLTAAEERDLLMLNADQKKAILDGDKSAKNGYLAKGPAVSNGGIKTHPKFVAYEKSISQ